MNVDVIKIAKYDPTFGGKYSRYQGYCISTSEKAEPILVPEACTELKQMLSSRNIVTGFFFHSTLKRGVETANCILSLGASIMPCDDLNEIPFSLESLLSEEEFNREGSNLVRSRFVQAFIDDKLLIKRNEIQDRVKRTLSLVKYVEQDFPSVGIISHSFFMKILEAEVKGNSVFLSPERLREVIPFDQKTYPFGGGFSFEV